MNRNRTRSIKFTAIILLSCLFALPNMLTGALASQVPYIEIVDERALNIISPDAAFEVLGTGYSWSEGPLWLPEQDMLIFSDVPQNTLYQYKEGEGVSVYLTPSGATGIDQNDSQQGGNGLLLHPNGQLVIMQHGDRRVAAMDAALTQAEPKFVALADSYNSKRFNSPNDGVFHSNGDLYFTDPPYGLKNGRKDANKQLSFDGIYRLRPSGELTLEDDSVLYPNGIVLSTDQSKAIVAASDREAAKWYQYDIDANGSLRNKRVFYDASNLVGQENEQGLPDGMVVHSAGYIFATGPGGVFVFNELGELLAKIRTGKATANCTLSGDEKTLYMTAHDTLMRINLK
ncbi:SMP-30/gluconolactonase/LRE family protein [Glaciecola siphonariae]|uniref:SMP-30/gluconolactonase/LRE family protein n=1 Tax=Glaciecola siphonariae TaxID=521012 RepID=A0ABV9M006_9ALTE